MGQAGVDLPDPLETRPTFGRPPAGAGGARPGGAAGTAAAGAANALPDDADADDLLSQLAGEEIDRLLAAADLDAEPLPELPAPVPVSRPAPQTPPSSSPAATPPKPRTRRRAKDQPPAARPVTTKALANPVAPWPAFEPKPPTEAPPLSPGAHNVIAPHENSDPAVQAEFDDAFEQLAGDNLGGAIPELEYAPAHVLAEQRGKPLAPEPVQAPAAPPLAAPPAASPPADPSEEPFGELLEQLTAVRAEVEAEVRAEAAAEAAAEARAGAANRDASDKRGTPSHPAGLPALLTEAEHQAFNLVVPEPAPPVVLTPDASLEASLEAATEAELESRLDVGLEAAELEQTTSSPERAALGFGDVEPGPDAGASTVARSRAAVVPQDEETFLIEPPDATPTTPLPVRLLEWVNKPLAAFPEAVRQAVGKVAILTLINAILVLLYVLLVRS